ncbi:T9SS type A sorting domain-containing protein [Aequorivita sp. CIP111184]|uniref:T9SS type A sorting domain-containing protein n=1 Tax=Aequorivita sp. CIP111184 TaxID=2211356 RepID=UPI000DBC3846|nr:T9SS type A sorting domain-containing protein [Aequorivita sp. CIP111184]SRX52837.1 hypothetical protein AEQU1_00707 [Aequorivita sp. CIP111184]
MKQLYILLAILTFQTSVAQNPQLFEYTWYLYSMQPTDLDPVYMVSEIEPPINPYLVINENLEFYGEGACNSFNGLYEAGQNFLTILNFTETGEDCGIPEHNSFEDGYFYVIMEMSYSITQDGSGYVLTTNTALLGNAVFKSYPLSASDFQKNKFQLYPNPAKDKLFLSTTSPVENLKIKIFNIEGKLLSNQTLALEKQTAIDVSNLSSGMYFLNIEDENGNTVTKKFLKE